MPVVFPNQLFVIIKLKDVKQFFASLYVQRSSEIETEEMVHPDHLTLHNRTLLD